MFKCEYTVSCTIKQIIHTKYVVQVSFRKKSLPHTHSLRSTYSTVYNRDHKISDFSRAFRGSGQTSRVRVGSADPTRPAKILRCVDLTRPDPRDFESLLTQPDPTRPVRFESLLTRLDPTREISKPPDPTRPATFRLTRETRVSCGSGHLDPRDHLSRPAGSTSGSGL